MGDCSILDHFFGGATDVIASLDRFLGAGFLFDIFDDCDKISNKKVFGEL
jgi:hypothetical protein